MTSIVIAAIPSVSTDSPLMAPAVLKANLEQNNIQCIAIDLNAEVRNWALDRYPIVRDFLLFEKVLPSDIEFVYQLIQRMADRIIQCNTNWVGLSLLTYQSQITAKWLCFALKERNPNIKIVLGGAGCFSTLKSIDSFVTQLKNSKLIDHYIIGDGEVSLVQLLTGNIVAGVDSNCWQEISNLNSLPPPNFDDYDWSLYNHKKIMIWGSRGCVRHCTFCDIHEHWSKFAWRSAENIFSEMLLQYNKYGINLFHFADSLVNGNQKEYRKLLKLLAEFNSSQIDEKKIYWGGFFIFRNLNQMPESDWELTKASGATMLIVGVESLVEHIRFHIKKKFTNDDLEYGIKMAQKYNVNLTLLLIIGYVTETQSDHEYQLEWIRNHAQYANNPIQQIHIGHSLAILPGTWLHRNMQQLNVKLLSDQVYQNWVCEETNSTPNLRAIWTSNVIQTLTESGFNVAFNQDNHELIERNLKN